MASLTARCVRRLCVGRNLSSSYLFAPSGRTAFQQKYYWGKPSRLLSPLRGRRWTCGSGNLYYSTSSGEGGEGGEGEEEREEEEREEEGEEEDVGGDHRGIHQTFALAPVAIPDMFPEVPILPISRNPIFPKFVKMLEVRVCVKKPIQFIASHTHTHTHTHTLTHSLSPLSPLD